MSTKDVKFRTVFSSFNPFLFLGTLSLFLVCTLGTRIAIAQPDGCTPEACTFTVNSLRDEFLYTEFVFPNLAPTGASTELKFGFREDTDFSQLDDVLVRAVPVPGTLLLLGSGLVVFVAYGWRRRKPFARVIATVLMWCAMGIVPTRATDLITDDDFTPVGIQKFLNTNRDCPVPKADTNCVDTTDKFVQSLPVEFAYNFIMMTKSESLQTGTATSPRFILSDLSSTRVFGVALDSQIIEYLRFDKDTKKFDFHEITMTPGAGGTIEINKPGCLECHASTRDDLNPKASLRGRPNWDAYDFWGGALPFNRDRIYQGSAEEKAVKRIFNDEDLLKDHPFINLLFFPGLILDPTPPITGKLTIDYTACDPGIATTNDPCKTDPGNGKKFLRVESFAKDSKTDEGRGVALFDLFTGYNALRVAQELVDFPTDPVDIRPVALAILTKDPLLNKDCVTAETLKKYARKGALNKLLAYQTDLDPNIKSFPDLLADTREKMKSLPKKKADLEFKNLDGLKDANGVAADPQAEIGLRSRETGFPPGLPQTYNVNNETDKLIDRECYDSKTGDLCKSENSDRTLSNDNETFKIALFRLFLEPLGVAVDMWSMSVRSTKTAAKRNKTYTFGDLFNQVYIPAIKSELTKNLGLGSDLSCSALSAASKKQFKRRF